MQRCKHLIAAALFILIPLFNGLAAQVPDWDDTITTEISGNNLNKAIAKRSIRIGSDNTLHVIYGQEDGDDWNLYYINRNNSDEWSVPELILTDFGYTIDIALILHPYQNDLKFYAASGGSLYEVSQEETGGWSTESISTGTSNISFIDAAIDTQGKVHLIGITSNMADEPKLIYVTDYNGDWSHDVLMDSWLGEYGLGAEPVIDVDTSGIAVIAYRGGTYGQYHIHIAQNEVAGEFDWYYEIISTPNANDLASAIRIVDNTIHLAHSGQDGFGFPWRTYYSRRHINSLSWTAPELVSGPLSLVDPTIIIDLEGNVHIVMVEIDGNFATGDIYYSHNIDDEWELSNPFEDEIWEYPTMVLDHSGGFQLLKKTVSFDGGVQYGVVHKGAPYQTVLPVPLDLNIDIDGFNAVLNWDSPDIPPELSDIILEGYNIWRQTFGAGPYEIVNDELVETNEYMDVNLFPGDYSYYVTALYQDLGESGSSNTVNITILDQLPAPEIDPPGGEYENFVYVNLSSPNGIGDIHYTLDGEDPTENSNLYDIPILIEETAILKAKTFHPNWQASSVTEAEFVIITTGIEEDYPLITETRLHPAKPNPFNPETVISFDIKEKTPVNITVYNLRGQRVRELVNEHKEPGNYQILWDGKDQNGNFLPSGLYFYRMKTSDQDLYNKMMLLK